MQDISEALAGARRLMGLMTGFTRVVVIAIVVALGFAVMSQFASANEPPARAEIETVIRDQISSFRKDDAASAFAHASPKIQAMFRTPKRFIEMVARGYPQIYRAKTSKFLPVQTVHGMLIQRVLITSDEGELITAAYAMVKVDGAWRIDGCWIVNVGARA